MSFSHEAIKAKKAAGLTGMKSSTKDKIEGAARTSAGIIKEETGKALKNPDLQAEGEADQFVGNAQKSIGRIKKALGS